MLPDAIVAFPDGHIAQAVAPDTMLNVPAAHAVQWLAPTSEKLPLVHLVVQFVALTESCFQNARELLQIALHSQTNAITTTVPHSRRYSKLRHTW